jgi:hypothetical protein
VKVYGPVCRNISVEDDLRTKRFAVCVFGPEAWQFLHRRRRIYYTGRCRTRTTGTGIRRSKGDRNIHCVMKEEGGDYSKRKKLVTYWSSASVRWSERKPQYFDGFCRLCFRLRAALLLFFFSLSFTTCFGLHGHLQVCRISLFSYAWRILLRCFFFCLFFTCSHSARFHFHFEFVSGRDSNFNPYELEHWEVGVRVPVGSRIFASPYRPHRLWDPPSCLSNGSRGLFPRG